MKLPLHAHSKDEYDNTINPITVVTGDDVKEKKPDPSIYLTAANVVD